MPRIWADNIEERTNENTNFRTVLRVNDHSELTLMSIPPGGEIGVEVHETIDQFLRVEAGQAQVKAGASKDDLNETYDVKAEWAFIVPAGTWHNVINTGPGELKLYSLYAPPEHPDGTVHRTKADAEAAEHAG